MRLDSEFKFDHDLILYIFYKDPFTPHVQVEMGDPNACKFCALACRTYSVFDSTASPDQWRICLLAGLLKENLVMLNFLPELSVDGAASDYKEVGEYIIVVDRSGNCGLAGDCAAFCLRLNLWMANLYGLNIFQGA